MSKLSVLLGKNITVNNVWVSTIYAIARYYIIGYDLFLFSSFKTSSKYCWASAYVRSLRIALSIYDESSDDPKCAATKNNIKHARPNNPKSDANSKNRR
jgi:hypothetical protein